MTITLNSEEDLSPSVRYINIVHRESEGWITKANISDEGYKVLYLL